MSIASRKVIVGITGASGSVYALKLVNRLISIESISEIAVVFSSSGEKVWNYELVESLPEDKKLIKYRNDDLFAAPASGSAGYDTMFVIPCSMGSIGKMASGIADNLLTRAADVILKENRKLLIFFREAPLNRIHLQNLLRLSEAGAFIAPASPFFYHHPQTKDELLDALVSRIIAWAGLGEPDVKWGE